MDDAKTEQQAEQNGRNLIKFHVELPIGMVERLDADAKRSGRSRRAHVAYLISEVIERGGNDYLFPRSQQSAAA